ncbi:hypothetical protein NGM10_16385 (plasmid) [Halorussus salilacus]|uniref:hypothetical protein n=1 Tax=Halorussus salilacus TaxID=2953750 RepID=UPI0020A0EA43|nr:hypothetical protein [Halorussus salilacus]USZ69981.1 hypothetical protein NGM10_16385 [Halorussus salilacus]
MAIPTPDSPTQMALVAVGAVVAFLVVVPLLPTVFDLLFGAVRSVFDVVVPGGRTAT